MSGVIEERKVDSKGRIYLTSMLKNKTVYMLRRDDFIIIARSRRTLFDIIKKIDKSNVIDEYLKIVEELGEPSPKEIERVVGEGIWRKLKEFS